MVRIDKNSCIGCGICEGICPEGIEMKNGKAEIKDPNAPCLKDAAKSCPRNSIILDENTKENKYNTNQNSFEENFNSREKNERTFMNGLRRGIGRGMGRRMGKGQGMGRRWGK